MNVEITGSLYDSQPLGATEKGELSPAVPAVLLGIGTRRPPVTLTILGIGVYVAALTALLTIDFSSPPAVLEAPVDMVYEEPAAPEEPEQPPPPPEPEPQPEPIPEPTPEPLPEPLPEPEKPPEPVKEEIKPKPVEPPKPVAKPKPRSATPTPGAIPTDYANKVYQRINRVASGSFPKSALSRGQSVRISYSIVIGSGGELISKSVGSSGNAVMDRAAAEALARSAPFPTPPALGSRTYKISGAIVYRAQ
ncbi:cell envelope integrity protein TolA [Rhodomicrobium lacus]|uniref:cell envelope integrity protein TolA n=1 Tax=Rhodomicrobium lacus TaxID=2498452 RepID=UPI000F8C8AA0|nr:cell envelope integrity protein TolA [Rhodomicrobium lacus]